MLALSHIVHPGLPERLEVFADRLAVFPDGFLVLGPPGGIAGYGVSHPAPLFAPPPLDHLLGSLTADADGYYIHDVVVEPGLRGSGHAGCCVRRILALAARWPATALISVYGTMPFWQRFGFADRTPAMPPEKLAPYGADARYMVRRGNVPDA